MIKWRIIDVAAIIIGVACSHTNPMITCVVLGYLFMRCADMTMNVLLYKKPT